jgi:hypothetical protein
MPVKEEVMTLGRILAVLVTMLLQSGTSDAQEKSRSVDSVGILSHLGEPQVVYVADGDWFQGSWTSLAFTQDSNSLVGTLQRNPGSRVLFLLGHRIGEVRSFDLTAENNKLADGTFKSTLLMSAYNINHQILTTPSGSCREPLLLAGSDRPLKEIEVVSLDLAANEPEETLLGQFPVPRNEKTSHTNNSTICFAVTPATDMLVAGTGCGVSERKEGRSDWTWTWWGDVKGWDLRSGESRFAKAWDGNQVLALACSADGKLVAAAGGHGTDSNRYDGRVACWERGFEQKRFDLSLPKHQVYCLAFSPDSTTLITGGIDGKVKWIDVKQGTVTKSINVASQAGSKNVGQVESLAFSPNGILLAAGAGSWNIGDTRWGATFLIDLRQGTVHEVPSSREDHVITCVAFSPDGKYLAAGGMEGILKLWDLTGTE